MAAPVGISVQPLDDEVVLVELQTDFDVHSSRPIKDAIYRELEKNGRRHLVLSLEQARYIDSTGLGSLLSILRRVREVDGNMVLVCRHPHQLKVLNVTGLDRIFGLYPTVEEAASAVAVDPAVEV